MKFMIALIAALMMLTAPALAEDGDTLTAALPVPLPKGAWINRSHSSEDILEIFMPDNDSFASCTIALQPDGRWLLCHTADTSISEDMLWFGVLGPYYGDVLMERDVTRLDWTSLPTSYEDFLPLVDASCWAVVTGNGAPLLAEDGSILAEYLPATPVLLLEAVNGQHRVAINGGSITGWMDDGSLLIGENQLTVDDEGYLTVVEDGFMWGEYSYISEDSIPLYDAPEGSIIGETGFRIDLLARWPGGWLHVYDEELGIDGFIREDSVIPLNEWGDALAEPPSAQSVLESAYPGATILASAEDADDAFFVLDMGDYKPRRLCGLIMTDGAWTLVIDSDTAVLPDYFENEYRQWRIPYSLTMTLSEDELILHYKKNGETETFIFRRSEGEWRFAHHERHDVANDMLFTLDWDGYTLTQHRIDDRGDMQTPPCPMPWLAEEVSLAKFNARTFPTSLWDLGDEDLSRVAAQLLPNYTYGIGKFWLDAASFLMTRPDGALVFMGGVYEDGAWVWTESTPLPEDTWCDDYHSGGSSFIIGWDHPHGEPDEFGDYPYVEYVIYLQEDGSWKVETIFDYFGESFHFVPEGLYINMTGLVYGESTLERDVTKIDWATYPLCLEDVLPTMSHDWGVISEPSLPLYADPDEAVLLAEYHCATPVRILEEADDLAEKGWEGHLVKVQIADSDVVGWMQGYGILTGKYQVWEQHVEDEDGDWSYYETAEYEDAWFVVLDAGADLYAAPEGEVIWTADENVWLVYMADYGNGWAHVKFPESLESCFVRVEDCLPAE